MTSVTGIAHDPAVFRPAYRVGELPRGGLIAVLRDGRKPGVIDLAAGTPGAPRTSTELIDAACAALRGGANQYEDPAGNAELRAQLAASFAVPADPETEITVTVGASEGLCLSLMSTVDPGDEVIVLEPFYENFLGAIGLVGGRPRFVRMRPPDWRYDPAELAAAFGPRTKAIVLNSPANPTGRVLTRAELAEIAELCARWDVTVISDEAYAKFVFDGRQHVSVADLPELRSRSFVIGSLSKSHAVSGWRLGFVRAEPRRTQALRDVHIATTCGTAGPLQRAAAQAGVIAPGAWNPAPHLQELRDRVVAVLVGAGISCVQPEGGCYVMADIRSLTDQDCLSWVGDLVQRTGVLFAPGLFFFQDESRGSSFVRAAFNRPVATIDMAAERLLGAGT
nr:aminotransferase [uncultured bacterium]